MQHFRYRFLFAVALAVFDYLATDAVVTPRHTPTAQVATAQSDVSPVAGGGNAETLSASLAAR